MMNERTEIDWESRSDAHILSQAEQIKMDSARLSRAKEAANLLLKEKVDDLASLKKVATAKDTKKEFNKIKSVVNRGIKNLNSFGA